jgi:hypothetical protein
MGWRERSHPRSIYQRGITNLLKYQAYLMSTFRKWSEVGTIKEQ